MISEVCGVIKEVDKCLSKTILSTGDECLDELGYTAYCPNAKNGKLGECRTNGGKLSAWFIWLLEMFKTLTNVDDFKDINGQYVEYAILWLNSKNNLINSDTYISTTTIYDILEINSSYWYNEFRDKIEKKRNAMNFGDYYMHKLYNLLKEICSTINKYNEDKSYPTEYLKHANKCVNTYKDLVTNVPKGKMCTSYCDVLSTLKNSYDKFREEIDDDPEHKLPEFIEEGIQNCKNLCKSNEQKLENEKARSDILETVMDIPVSLSDEPPTEVSLSGESSGDISDNQEELEPVIGHMDISKSIILPSEAPTSINNGNKVTYIVVPFTLILIILGILYKYLIHGQRKKLKRKKNANKIINLRDKK
ncbi:CIR protein [Plasmodium chabaudi chabaudi]|uniref:CIR protein n=1 Tax=Plasmodium chabaudi chabaudi TaxID=31271 RepID=A0A1D3L6L8_PLACU|nr:CIR protein [Plasmodium chabaudi chabaudi]